MPPGIAPAIDSGTYRRDTPRAAREVDPPDDDVVFFPVAPGVPSPGMAEKLTDAAPPMASPVWQLTLPAAGQVTVGEIPVFIGRNPAATEEHPQAQLIAADDPAKALSKTHAMLEVDDGKLWVHDLASTNGVFVGMPGVDAIEVVPGARAQVPNGAELELGDYIIRVRLS